MSYYDREYAYKVLDPEINLALTRRKPLPWYYIAVATCAAFLGGIGGCAVAALIVVWAVRDTTANGVTWLPAFVLLITWSALLAVRSSSRKSD